MPSTRSMIEMTTNAVFVKDGAMGTQLEQWVNIREAGPLWSSSILLSDPSLVQRVHAAYIDAGADILLTCTYQMSGKACAEANVTMPELVDQAVRAAQDCLDRSTCAGGLTRRKASGTLAPLLETKKNSVLLAGSLGPYGASLPGGHEYWGDYTMSEDEIASFHGDRLAAFVDGDSLKVDFLLLETFPRLDEALGICAWIKRQSRVLYSAPICFAFVAAPVPAFFPPSGTAAELDDWWRAAVAAVHLPDGQTIAKALEELRCHRPAGLIGIGCNCSGPLEVCLAFSRLLEEKKSSAAEQSLALLISPNSGEGYADGEWINKEAQCNDDTDDSMAALQRQLAKGDGDIRSCVKYCLRLFQDRPSAADWLFDSLVCGGCCRSTPADICTIKSMIQ